MDALDTLTRDEADRFLAVLREQFDWLRGEDTPIGCTCENEQSDAGDTCFDLRQLYRDLETQRLNGR